MQLLTPEQAAAMLGTTEPALRVMRARNKGPAFVRLPNGRIRYTVQAIEAWVYSTTEVAQ